MANFKVGDCVTVRIFGEELEDGIIVQMPYGGPVIVTPVRGGRYPRTVRADGGLYCYPDELKLIKGERT